jgi:hypothetical protein
MVITKKLQSLENAKIFDFFFFKTQEFAFGKLKSKYPKLLFEVFLGQNYKFQTQNLELPYLTKKLYGRYTNDIKKFNYHTNFHKTSLFPTIFSNFVICWQN